MRSRPSEDTQRAWLAYPGVEIGANATIQPYVLIGVPPQGTQPGELTTSIGNNALLRSHTVIYAGASIGHDFQTGHGVLIREMTEIGDEVSIGSHTVIEHRVSIGSRVRVHSQAFVPEFSTLQDECWIGPNVVITNAKYPATPETKEALQGVLVRRWARIGANATLLSGLTVGEHALVGAGSVVTKDVPPKAVVAGNPAQVIRYI